MAKAKIKKAVTRKRRERKNIERGAAHIRSSVIPRIGNFLLLGTCAHEQQ